MSTQYYRKRVTVTTSTTTVNLPPLNQVSLLNVGSADCQLEFDGSIGADSLDLKQNTPMNWNMSPAKLYLKTSSGSTEVFVTGVRREKA